jgi:hypothetical protein
MVKVVNETLRHCLHCGDRLTERNWCRHCGDITWLDEYPDDQLDRVELERKDETHNSLSNSNRSR